MKICQWLLGVYDTNFNSKRKHTDAVGKITCALELHGVKILKLDYNPKVFGNIVCDVEYRGELFHFITDRGEFYSNGTYLCNYADQIHSDTELTQLFLDTVFKVLEITATD